LNMGNRVSNKSGAVHYDVKKLANALTSRLDGRLLSQTRFYTAVPAPEQCQFWHGFWTNKIRYLRSQHIYVYRGYISGVGKEKGVDVSIAIDLVNLAYENPYDLAIVVSSDRDLGPAIRLARRIATDRGRTTEFESAFPYDAVRFPCRGIPGTTWVHIDKALYDVCFDPTDYRSTRS